MNRTNAMARPRFGFGGGFLKRFGKAAEGFAAVETALVAPAMIALCFGVMELCEGYVCSGKVTAAASTAADLVAQDSSICDAEMNDVYAAVGAIIFPYSLSNMQVRISSLIDAGNSTVKVAWSSGYNTSPRGLNSTVTIPAGLVTSGGGQSVIFAEVTYYYTSPTGQLFHGAREFSDKFYLHPRRTAQISRTSGC